MATIVAQEQYRRALLPPSVRTMILARLSPLSLPARQLVMASAVLGTSASAQLLWQMAELGSLPSEQVSQASVEALEEAVKSGMLREEEAGGGRLGGYRFAHDLMRDVVYTEMGEARRQVLHQRAFALLQASELAYHVLASGQAEATHRSSVQVGYEAMAVFAVEKAIGHYE